MSEGAAGMKRFAGGNRELQAAAILGTAAALGATVPSVAGLADLFTGPTNGLNSGEIPLNFLIAMLPGFGLYGGAALAAQQDPMAKLLINTSVDALKAKAASGGDWSQVPAEQLKAYREAAQGRGAAVVEDAVKYREAMLKRNPEMSDDAILERLLSRSGRRLATGAALGSLAGAVPAVLLMQDGPQAEGSSAR